ncbi:UNVERIFIED_CONTAM: hypothetical protein Sindi_2323100 [Sesamum indicum]
MPIQSFLLPQWKWFVDYATIGNRIWLAWDENIIDVHVLDSGEQFLHCRVTSRTDNEVVIITIVYGASEVIDRRALWTTLGTIAQQCTDEPWLVGGDFNAVRDLNEVCGISVDIRMAMEEFNAGIQEAGLLPLPMQVSRKLKALKPVFRQQRRNKGDLTLNVQLAKGFLEEAQNLVSSDRQNELFLFLEHCCRLVYAKAVKLEQIMLQQRAKMQWMKGGDQCSRIFFRKIAQRRAVRRILQINDENGTTHTEPSEVVQEFVSFYQNLLGGNRRRLLVDITYLRPWARHILSNEEASHLILPFSPEDVKLAIFGIAEDKTPGPDGFSSGFFKAAWPVVGTEVTRAVLDFFTTGKLLKQVNTTLLALIPKYGSGQVNQSLPNSLHPGKKHWGQYFVSTETFHRIYQIRLPPRCALKVDIRKAYDTVEWDFLAAVLQFFNFPTTFIRWIEECITTASFSIGLNGKPHGFFNGARGLRQGDPLSPYLFVLVMEILHLEFLQLIEQDMQFTYHWKCEPARVFQLGFADDLLLFCRADMDSVRVFKMGLDRFAEWSGLRLNIQKSHLILSRSAQDRREHMLAVLGFQEGHLPMRYLGLPLLSSRLSISDCQPLLSKIDAHTTGWEGISLSYAGRVQIIKSVLSTLSLYWASAFILPKVVIKEVEKRLRTFLWKGTSMTGYAKVAWKDICKPVEEGGLGIKDIGVLNRALMTKNCAMSLDVTEHLSGLSGCSTDDYGITPYGQLANREDRGVGEKCFVCAALSNQWWSFILEMGEASIFGRIHGINLDPCFLDFHADRTYLDLKTPLSFLRSLKGANGTGPSSRIWNASKSHIHYPRFMEAMIRSFGDFLRGNPLPKHFTDFFACQNRKWAGLHYFRDL